MKNGIAHIVFIFLIFFNLENLAQSTFSSQRLEQSAINYLQKHFSSKSYPNFLMKFPEISFQSSTVKAKFEYIENKSSSIQKLDILFYDNNELVRKIEIPFKIKIQREVVVANRDIPPNSILKDEDLITISREVEDINQIFSEIYDAVGKLSNRRIAKGEIIQKRDLQQPKVITRGQNVNIEVISGNVKIYTNGIAIQDGSIGDVIRVRRDNEDHKSTIEGTVVGENLVQIILRR